MARRASGPLIVGSGIAGLYVALRLHERGIAPTIVTKARLEESNTRYAQGGIAAAIGPDDSFELHRADTIAAGAGLVDLRAARFLAMDAPSRIGDLVRYGVPFDTVDGVIALGREAAHSRARILHSGGDATGLSIEETLRARVLEAGIEVRERTMLRALIPKGRSGLEARVSLPKSNDFERLDPRPVILATGGAGGLYLYSSNPSITTGDGLAVAFRAGALLTDMEFVQFHPTVFWRPGAPRFLLTEALRGEGAWLRNADGERFMPRYHPDAELAPRDIVARAIAWELERTGAAAVSLDATALPRDRLYARFPSICRFLEGQGIDPTRETIPVAPMAHYTIGGVRTDLEGRTSVPGLYACGEVASTGVHGANRLASNSLLEGLVFGERLVRALSRPRVGAPSRPRRLIRVVWPRGRGGPSQVEVVEEIRRRLWKQVGILRDGKGLEGALHRFYEVGQAAEPPDDEPAGRVAQVALTAYLVTRAALTRTESRGAHYRVDYPTPRPAWRTHLGLLRAP